MAVTAVRRAARDAGQQPPDRPFTHQAIDGFRRAIVYAFTTTDVVRRRLWLSRSVIPFTLDLTEEPDQAVLHALELLKAHDRLESGEPVVIVANVTTSNGHSNAIQVRTIE